MKSKITGIYLIKSKQTGRCYVGQSVSVYERWKAHERSLRKGSHCNRIMQGLVSRNGLEDLEFSILVECNTFDLDTLECHYINLYKAMVDQGGMNLVPGGFLYDDKTPISKEIRERNHNKLRHKYITKHGFITLEQASNISGIPKRNLKARLYRGYTLDQAMDKGIRPKKPTFPLGLTDNIYYGRLRSGWTKQEALSTPVGTKRVTTSG